MRLDELTLATFEPLVGERFTLDAGSDSLALVLANAVAVAQRPEGREPFSLEFRGPREPVLAQAIYGLEHATLGRLDIFIVPIAQDADATTYQAIFA